MDIVKEYGGTVAAVAVGAFIGVALLGFVLNIGEENDISLAEKIRDGLGG